jgi:hypothetical protein
MVLRLMVTAKCLSFVNKRYGYSNGQANSDILDNKRGFLLPEDFHDA